VSSCSIGTGPLHVMKVTVALLPDDL
jgi:hypothetical protein